MSIINQYSEFREMQINFDKILNYYYNDIRVSDYLDTFLGEISETNQQNLVNAIFEAINTLDSSAFYKIKVTIPDGTVAVNTFKIKSDNTYNNFINGILGQNYNSQPELLIAINSPYKNSFISRFMFDYLLFDYTNPNTNALAFRKDSSTNNFFGCIILYAPIYQILLIM